jgi:cytochrome c biogenesis protein CcmG/thiol:disulfide interchange protein DsbE
VRARLLVLPAVAVLLAAAFAVRAEREGPASATIPRPPAVDLAALRDRAQLDPCPPGLGPALPDVVLPCLSGGPDVALSAAAPGRPMLVNVWGTWCRPCVAEVPELVAFAEKAGDRVGLVGVLTQDTQRLGLEFAREFAMHYPSLVDEDGVVLRAFAPGPPVTLFLDAQGNVVHRKSGAFEDLAELETLVAQHLGVQL